MASSTTVAFLLLACLGAAPQCLSAPSGAFRGAASGPADHTVAATEVETSLQEVFAALQAGGRGGRAPELAKIEAGLWQTFQALPKNAAGRLPPAAVRYVVHKYFAKEHGWVIRGLEPDASGAAVAAGMHNASILQDRAPAFVEALLEARQSGAGLALDDIVTMVATLEHLVLHDSVLLLEASYALNNRSSLEAMGPAGVAEILQSYLLLFGQGEKADIKDTKRHQDMKAYLAENVKPAWENLVDYQQDAQRNYDFARQGTTSPFAERKYPFDAALGIAQDLAHGYGKWQNDECVAMKDALVRLDPKGTGRVPLGAFYNETAATTWQFSESVEQLRAIGALEETSYGRPKVLVANYLAQPTNCIATSAYYSVCCLNECEAIMNEVEEAVQAPTASADRLLRVVGDISSATVEAPREVPQALQRKLREVADSQGGDVAIHGRLFSQWLHFAFPNECAYPHTQEAGTLAISEWFNAGMNAVEATDEERRQHIDGEVASAMRAFEAEASTAQAQANDGAVAAGAAAAGLVMDEANQTSARAPAVAAEDDDGACSLEAWKDEEHYHVEEPVAPVPAAPGASPSWSRSALRVLAQLTVVGVVAQTAYTFFGTGGRGKKAEAEGFWSDLPLRGAGRRGLLLPA